MPLPDTKLNETIRHCLPLAVVLLTAVAAIGQSPAKILAAAERALGGRKALESVKSMSRTGLITDLRDGSHGSYVSESSRPDLERVRYDLNGIETEVVSNGRSAWIRDLDGLRTLTGKLGADIVAESRFRSDLWLHYRDQKAKLANAGVIKINGRDAQGVRLTTPKGNVYTVYMDAVTGLPLRDEVPEGDGTVVTDYSDYRQVQGLNVAFRLVVTEKGRSYDVDIKDVWINPPILPAAFDFPIAADQPLPDLKALIDSVQANEDRIDSLLDTYSLTQKITSRELAKDGILRDKETETYQLSFYKGRRIRRLVAKNGRQLTPKEQADADRDATRQVEAIDKASQKRDEARLKNDKSDDSEKDRRVSVAELLRASRLSSPRRERYKGRDVIVFDFGPDPDFDFSGAKSMLKFFGKTAGVMWIDEKDHQVARVDAVLADSYKIGGGVLAKMQKGASFSLESERVNDELWLPSRAAINLSLKVLMLKGIDVNEVVESSEYRKFTTEVKDASVNEIKTP